MLVHAFAQGAAVAIAVAFWMSTVGLAFPPALPFVLPHAVWQGCLVGAVCCRNYHLEYMETYIASLLVTGEGEFLFSPMASRRWRFWYCDMPLFIWHYLSFWGFHILLLVLTFVPYVGPLVVLVLNSKATGAAYYARAQGFELTHAQRREKFVDLFMFGSTAAVLEFLPVIGGISYTTTLVAARRMVRADYTHAAQTAREAAQSARAAANLAREATRSMQTAPTSRTVMAAQAAVFSAQDAALAAEAAANARDAAAAERAARELRRLAQSPRSAVLSARAQPASRSASQSMRAASQSAWSAAGSSRALSERALSTRSVLTSGRSAAPSASSSRRPPSTRADRVIQRSRSRT